MEEVWYKKSDFEKRIKKFHDEYCRQPEMAAARQKHEQYIGIIDRELRVLNICKRLEYTGSSYEGVKVSKSPTDMDLEFDIQVILVGGDKLEVYPTERPGFFRLSHRGYTSPVRVEAALTEVPSLIADGDQLPEETARKFYSELQKIINRNAVLSSMINLRRHGPAIQMDVYADATKREKFYSVDMVPTFEVGNRRFVSKPEDGSPLSWRQSFSIEEKNKLRDIDRDQGCRRQVLRVLKVMKNRSSELKPLESCHLKRALFKVVDQQTSPYNWAFDRIGVRTIDVLKQIESELANDRLMHYFMPDVNQIAAWNPVTICDLRNRIRHLIASETQFNRLIA